MKWRGPEDADLYLVSSVMTGSSPPLYPVTRSDIKDQEIVDHTDDDDFIDGLIPGLVHQVEEVECWIQLITAVWDMKFDCFPVSDLGVIRIPRPPLQAVGSISYVDEDGDTQTWTASNYVVDLKDSNRPKKGEVTLAYNAVWPTIRRVRNAVTIRFTAGYGSTAADVPGGIRNWMKVMAANMYRFREADVDRMMYRLEHVQGLLNPYRAREPASAS